jgi:hypothetical protein
VGNNVLRSQLERYIGENLGKDYLESKKNAIKLDAINKELREVRQRLGSSLF